VRVAAVIAVGALALAACGSGDDSNDAAPSATGFNAAVGSVYAPTTTQSSGTLQLGSSSDCDSWDPASTYLQFCWNLQRLFSRGLMGYDGKPGEAGNVVVPDLATEPGKANDDFTEWTYTLREGLKWDDGSPLTAADVKYGIERTFDQELLAGGPTYHLCRLSPCDDEGVTDYAGPYKDEGGLDSISTPDDTTIVFKLTEPFAQWDYVMAFPSASAVPEDRDTGADYGKKPASSGPYVFDEYRADRSVTFTRNENWSPDTDPIRRPLVAGVKLNIFSSADDVDQRLEAGTLDAPVDGTVQPAFQSKIVSNPDLKAQADNPVTSFTRYLIASPDVAPLDNVHCRRAVQYAVNKTALQRLRGGTYGGEIANVMTPSNLPGHDAEANPYPNGDDNTGNLEQARAELEECGQADGFKTKLAYPGGDERTENVATAAAQALERVGIDAELVKGPGRTFYATFVGSPENVKEQGLGIQIMSWGPDAATPYFFWDQIAYGKNIKPVANYNQSMLDDPRSNEAIEEMTRTTDNDRLAELGQTVDEVAMEAAGMVPYVFDKSLFFRGERVANAYTLSGLNGYYDFVNMGLNE
jgi:peptide/nickel transport system substrate-binding protein